MNIYKTILLIVLMPVLSALIFFWLRNHWNLVLTYMFGEMRNISTEAINAPRKPSKPQELLYVPTMKFIVEQDGIVERKFKNKIKVLLIKYKHINAAYLVQVIYDESEELNVALCINSTQEDDLDFQKDIGFEFAQMFNSDEHLDVIFLRKERLDEISKICDPFYVRK